jgi:hypothetical protein
MWGSTGIAAAGLALALCGVVDTSVAQCELAKRGPTDAEASDQFGRAVAIDGTLAAVGVTNDRVFGVAMGSVAVFERDQGGADVWGQIAKLIAEDGAAKDQFGGSVAVDGDMIIVGASRDDDTGSSSGSAYIFARNEGGMGKWGQVVKLTADDAGSGDMFGISVDIDGDYAIVGAYKDDDEGSNAGAAYVFARNEGGFDNWGQIAKVTADDGHRGDLFGWSVAISGGYAVVGAQRDDDAGSSSGSAYVFARDMGGADNWGQLTKLHAGDAAANDQFGVSVALDGDLAMVGAYLKDGVGAAYLFDRTIGGADNWGQWVKLTADDATSGDYFGYTVAVHGDLAVAGAMGDDDAGVSSGSAYVFMQDQGGTDAWGQRWKLFASDGAPYDLYGTSVGVWGDDVLVGSVYDDDAGLSSGSAYVHERVGGGFYNFEEIRKLTAADGAGDHFGRSVGISGDWAVAGASLDDLVGPESGAVYVYRRDMGGPDVWGEFLKLRPSDAASYDVFGFSIALDDSRVIVGAPGKAGFTGAAYVFERDAGGTNAWGEVATLLAADAAAADRFGVAVAIDGDLAVVGSVYDDFNGLTDAGSVHLYQRDGSGVWGYVKKLVADDPEAFDWFGVSVGVSGDTVIVGADNKSLSAPIVSSSGAAYLFERNAGGTDNWGQVKRFIAPSAANDDHFGGSVAIDGDLAVVGATGVDAMGHDAGAAFVFARDEGGADNWGGVDVLFASDATAGAHFGVTVATDGTAVLVSADRESSAAYEAGAVYFYDVSADFAEMVKVTASDALAGALFGCSGDVEDGLAIVGAELDGRAGPDAGAGYFLDLDGLDCNLNGICDFTEVRDGTSQDVNENEIPDECECLSDLDGNGLVDWVDWMYAYANWGECEGCQADRNGDGVVDNTDLVIILSEFGPCPF